MVGKGSRRDSEKGKKGKTPLTAIEGRYHCSTLDLSTRRQDDFPKISFREHSKKKEIAVAKRRNIPPRGLKTAERTVGNRLFVKTDFEVRRIDSKETKPWDRPIKRGPR